MKTYSIVYTVSFQVLFNFRCLKYWMPYCIFTVSVHVRSIRVETKYGTVESTTIELINKENQADGQKETDKK